MSVTRKEFGMTLAGQQTKLYSIGNRSGEMTVKVSDYGATVVSVLVPDRNGSLRDVVLGYDEPADYEAGGAFFGACVGRNANRIKDGEFLINGKRYMLTKNDGNNNLHSGPDTYNKRLWKVAETGQDSVTFELDSPDMDQGFPGDIDIRVTYTVRGKRFEIHYEAVSDRDTIANFTNHSYFNLNGQDRSNVLNHLVWINASGYTETTADLIPTGAILPVAGTPYDFTSRKRLGTDIESGAIRLYDDNYVLDTTGNGMAANAYSSESGILMNVYTDRPGLQIYTPPAGGGTGKGGAPYPAYGAICFETQYFPDAVHQPGFASPILRAGEKYSSTTVYEFETVTV